MSDPVADCDSPWKEAIHRFLPAFLTLLFPHVYADIDFSEPYQVLDKELQQVARDAEIGRRLGDLLVQVYLLDGQQAWVLIHIEIQGQRDSDFPERMFVYGYRIYDLRRLKVASLAVLADEDTHWRPTGFA